MSSTNNAPKVPLPAEALRSAGALLIIATLLLTTVGLADDATLHRYTHDARHFLGFPCH